MYLIDTCVFSELIKKDPSHLVIEWILERDEELFFASALTFGEIKKGIAKQLDSAKKKKLETWYQEFMLPRFWSRLLPIDGRVANAWGQLIASAELQGRALPSIDSLIAATAIVHDLQIVTRNTKDFEDLNIPIINPWKTLI